MTLECDANFEKKNQCWFGKSHVELTNFRQRTQNSQNCDFHWILLYKGENV